MENATGVGRGELLRQRLLAEIGAALIGEADAFSEPLRQEIDAVVRLELGAAARTERAAEEDARLGARRAEVADPAPGKLVVFVYKPHPYVFRIDNLLDVLGVTNTARSDALDAAQHAHEGVWAVLNDAK